LALKGSFDRRSLIIAGAAVALLAAYAALGSAYTKFPGDLAVSTWMQSNGAGWLDSAMEAVSAAGTSYGALGALALAVLGTFGLRGVRPAVFLLAVAILGVLVRIGLKLVIARPRPPDELVRVMGENDGYSFPSGHVMFYVVLLGALYFLLTSPRLSGRTIRLVQAAIAVALVLTGISRIYLGVHWLSDVVAGYVFGAVLVVVAAWVWRRWAGP
jgi:undecaprenyl-diphosphatase